MNQQDEKLQLFGVNVLIVEDEALIALLLERELSKIGCTILDKVATGEDAIDRANRMEPDLILMDIKLAGIMDGIEAVRRMSLVRKYNVVFMSAFASPEVRTAVNDLAPLAFLSKPLKSEMLLPLVSKIQKKLED